MRTKKQACRVRIKGPETWADAIGCDRRWRHLAIHDDINYELQIVSLSEISSRFQHDISQTVEYPRPPQDDTTNLTIFKGQYRYHHSTICRLHSFILGVKLSDDGIW